MASCPNCGSELIEAYCAHCGQRQRAVGSMCQFVRESLDDQLGVDHKLPRTLKALFIQPGFLTQEYMAGRIVRYIPPFRLYLVASVLFFVLLSFLSSRSDWAERAEQAIEAGDSAVADTLAALAPRDSSGMRVGVSFGEDRQWLDSVRVEVPWQWLDQKIETNMTALGKLPPGTAMRRITNTIIEEMPKVMFVLLPVFALLLKLVYIRRRRLYLEHMIFALHLHTFAMLLFSGALLVRFDWVMVGVTAAISIYTLIAMKRVYGQGWIKTTGKWLVLEACYFVVFLFGLLFAMLWALAATSAA
jgi:hypothetical protein